MHTDMVTFTVKDANCCGKAEITYLATCIDTELVLKPQYTQKERGKILVLNIGERS